MWRHRGRREPSLCELLVRDQVLHSLYDNADLGVHIGIVFMTMTRAPECGRRRVSVCVDILVHTHSRRGLLTRACCALLRRLRLGKQRRRELVNDKPRSDCTMESQRLGVEVCGGGGSEQVSAPDFARV